MQKWQPKRIGFAAAIGVGIGFFLGIATGHIVEGLALGLLISGFFIFLLNQ